MMPVPDSTARPEEQAFAAAVRHMCRDAAVFRRVWSVVEPELAALVDDPGLREALAWVAAELERLEQRVKAVCEMPPIVFAADPKEREMLSKDVVVRVLTGTDAE